MKTIILTILIIGTVLSANAAPDDPSERTPAASTLARMHQVMDASGAGGEQPVSETGQRLKTIIEKITNWGLGLLISISVLFVIYAAYIYLTAGGDVEKVKTANRIILYAALAIGVGLLSKTLVAVVTALFKK